MYADQMTNSMEKAIKETNRNRQIQIEYNQKHKIVPETIKKEVRTILTTKPGVQSYTEEAADPRTKIPRYKLEAMIAMLQEEMLIAAQNLEFEKATSIRDKIKSLKGK